MWASDSPSESESGGHLESVADAYLFVDEHRRRQVLNPREEPGAADELDSEPTVDAGPPVREC